MEFPIRWNMVCDMDNNSRFEWKVGLFVLAGIVLIAALMLNFSKGVTLFQPTYDLRVVMPTVAGLKPKASVMMAGVPVGTVVSTDLSPSGTSVIIRVRILSKFKIHGDADFHIDALGFLGDQYIAITPTRNQEPLLKNGDTVTGVAPFDLQQAVRSTSGLLEQASRTLKNLDQAITNINQTILSQKTLTNFGNSIGNFQTVTESASRMSSKVEQWLDANSGPIAITMTNLKAVSEKLNTMADDLAQTFSTNRQDITGTIHDFRQTAANLKQISSDLEAGKGLAGGVLKDELMKAQAAAAISNFNQLAISYHQFSVRLNENGLWAVLRKPKTSPAQSTPAR